MNEWVNIKDEKPLVGYYVFVLFEFENGRIDIKREAYYKFGFDSFLSGYITHWMEYPVPRLTILDEKEYIDKLMRIEIRDRKLKSLGI